ncbi:MAG: hypothetical protein K0U64_07445 [Actinomycetia bacterium]|nr:hypothetical protein [Actinomycetes bacterium]
MVIGDSGLTPPVRSQPTYEAPVPRLTLNVSDPVWVAHFPELGTVHLFPGGHVSVRVAAGPRAVERYRALRWGWAEPLQLLRAGFHLTSLAMIDAVGRAMIVTGGGRHEAALIDRLSDAGWQLVADTMAPAQLSEAGLRVYARNAPALQKRPKEATATPVRAGSNVIETSCERARQDYPVVGVLRISPRRSTDVAGLHPLRGGKKLEMASHLLHRGPLPPEDLTPAAGLQRDLRLAALEMAELVLDDTSDDVMVDQILAWWDQL